MNRSDLLLAVLALLAGAFFMTSLSSLWPMVDADLVVDHDEIDRIARDELQSAGFDVTGWSSAVSVGIDARILDYVQREEGRDAAQALARTGYPVVNYTARFKKRDVPTEYSVAIHPNGQLLRVWRTGPDDDPDESLPVETAMGMAREALRIVGTDPDEWDHRSTNTVERSARVDHGFTFERTVIPSMRLRERAKVRVAGGRVDRVRRSLVLPGKAKRAATAAQGPVRALESVGFLLAAVFAIGAFLTFLRMLGDGKVRLRRAAILSFSIFVGMLGQNLMHSSDLFKAWEPLWSRSAATMSWVVTKITEDVWMTIVLLGVIGAADALDRDRPEGERRGRSLWLFLSGRWGRPEIALASARGFGIGLVCGGMLALTVALLTELGAVVQLQPRAVFSHILNSVSPPATALILFLNAALIEEIGYRWFGGTWMESLTGRRWVAIVVPAVVFGLTHTSMPFLPPAEPFYGRAITMTVVGLVWAWAFFKYDALTVVLSHWVADLVVFNTPRLLSGDPVIVGVTVATILVPLLPVVVWLGLRLTGRGAAD